MSLVDDLIPHMRRVQGADRDLHDLSLLWQMIEASSAISCPDQAETILPTLSQTRENFVELQQRLVRQLAQEYLAELGDELASVAQCTIDILVRNLFERTADVGFLATDQVLRDFCSADNAARAQQGAAFRARLAEYCAKYSVYDDIVVLACDGQVLARLDEQRPLIHSADPIVRLAQDHRAYVERYGLSDLATGGPALLYGHRIDDADGRCIGVLVLRFRCVDELQRIFSSVGDARHHLAIALVDGQGRVLVSNDEAHIPLQARLQAAADGQVDITVFAGREYLSVTCATRGYQGYGGPGWRAQAMVSLLTAFRGGHDDGTQAQQVALDNDALRRIQGDVDAINRNLRRVVWNGRLVAGASGDERGQLKAVLRQVNAASTRTRDRVAVAIDDLYRTSLGRASRQARELARLAADIMDRNLYERANDCRWWALSPVLRRVLAEAPDAAGSRALAAVLAHINGLYTVYTRLVAFDAHGRVRAASNDPTETPLTGTLVAPDLLRATLSLPDSQRYAVSAFEASPLSSGVPSYIYLAAVRAPDSQRVVGGIAIVFNAEQEFRNMLSDVLGPRQGLAAFVDAQGRVLSCTDERQAVGQVLALDAGQTIVEHDGAHLAVAAAAAAGYREFKHDDGYRNGVRAVVALRLGTMERRQQSLHDTELRALAAADRARTQELALFQVGPSRYALPLAAVLEARPALGLVRAPGASGAFIGLLEVPSVDGPMVIPVLCARRLLGVTHKPRATDGVVLVLPAGPGQSRPTLGLRVDDVLAVTEVGVEHVQDVPSRLRGPAELVIAIARLARSGDDSTSVLVQVLDFTALQRAGGVAPRLASQAAPALA